MLYNSIDSVGSMSAFQLTVIYTYQGRQLIISEQLIVRDFTGVT